jgi:signal transduction histidine kinase
VKLLHNFKQNIKHLSVDADRDRVTQVISNLVANAIKFTSKIRDGVIFVSAERKRNSNQEEVIVSIKDTGEWISTCPK